MEKDPSFSDDTQILAALDDDEPTRTQGIEMAMSKYAEQTARVIYGNLGMLVDEHDVVEAIDDAFKTLWEMTGTGAIRIDNLSGFLATVARRRAYDLARKKSSKRALDTVSIDDDNFPIEQLSTNDGPWGALELQDRLAQVRTCVARLVGVQRAFWEIQLRHFERNEFDTEQDSLLNELQQAGFPDATRESIKTCRREFRKRFEKLLIPAPL